MIMCHLSLMTNMFWKENWHLEDLFSHFAIVHMWAASKIFKLKKNCEQVFMTWKGAKYMAISSASVTSNDVNKTTLFCFF